MCAHALADERRRPSRHQGKVLNLCLRHDRIVVVMQTQLHVYTFSTRPEKLCVIETGNNPQGLCALSQLTAAPIVAFPVRDEGSLQITNLGSSDGVVVNAHHNALVCFALNADATRLATASAKGTCIRIFDTRTGDSVREVRRGIEHSLIRCMSFYTDSTRLLVASDKEDKSGTIHMFSLSNDDSVQNKHSKLFGLRSVLPSVFSSEWSFCQFHLDSPQPAQRSAQAYRTVCAFGPDKGTRHAALRLRSHLHRSARTRSTRVAAWYTQPRRTHARTHTHPHTYTHACCWPRRVLDAALLAPSHSLIHPMNSVCACAVPVPVPPTLWPRAALQSRHRMPPSRHLHRCGIQRHHIPLLGGPEVEAQLQASHDGQFYLSLQKKCVCTSLTWFRQPIYRYWGLACWTSVTAEIRSKVPGPTRKIAATGTRVRVRVSAANCAGEGAGGKKTPDPRPHRRRAPSTLCGTAVVTSLAHVHTLCATPEPNETPVPHRLLGNPQFRRSRACLRRSIRWPFFVHKISYVLNNSTPPP